VPPLTRSLEIRARVAPRPEPPFDRLHDPLVEDMTRGGEFSRARFATHWADTAALQRLAEAKRAALGPRLCEELAEYHRRLGASDASLESLELMRRGEGVCAVAGQQPAPLGGPLYSLHKTACAAGLAAAVTARLGLPCVPLFWMHGEDSDFAEIRGAALADASLKVREIALPDGAHRDGGLVGSIPIRPLAELSEQALGLWAGLPAQAETSALVRRSLARARDHGEAYSALMLALFGERGLVVIDPRLPAFRAAARPIIDRYLATAEELHAAARRAGELLEKHTARRPLSDSALDSFVFAIEDATRRKLSVAEARSVGPGRVLSPSVALRAVVQDGVFPTVAMACGSAEITYLAQLREVFEGLGVDAACAVPRLSATWLPPPAVALLDASGCGAWEIVTGADGVLKRLAEREVPADVRTELENARVQALSGLERFGSAAQRLDPSLLQLVDSARAKLDYQYARLLEGLIGKVRNRLERRHPEWLRLRYYLLPGDRLQERRLASLEVVAHRGVRVALELCSLAEEQARRLERGAHEHLLLEL